MKKDEAISILATSLRPREPKDRARYDEAVKMAIYALNCSEIPNNSDTISRQASIDKIKKRLYETALNNAGIKQNVDETLVDVAENRLENWFDELPSVQPERKGRWIPDDSELGIKCNKCGKSFSEYINAGTGYVFLMEIPNFCPNCGADMRGDKHETD